MAKAFAKSFYKSSAWARCRQAYINNRLLFDGGLCEECKKQLGYIVHHTIILNVNNVNNPDISLNHKYLKLVCKECHDKYDGHGVVKQSKQRLVFDKVGQPLPPN